MARKAIRPLLSCLALFGLMNVLCPAGNAGPAGTNDQQGSLSRVNHIIIVMQENHSFDNYFGVLPFAAGVTYHNGPCEPSDHLCVDGLSCKRNAKTGDYKCHDSNRDDDRHKVHAFHATDFCVLTDLNHEWVGSHSESNFLDPNAALAFSPNDGFVLVNDATNQPDNGNESRIEDEAMSFYNEGDLAFYYKLAETFAIDDQYFSSVLGPTFPNRSYLMAATSFGHLISAEALVNPANPLSAFYTPITGTIFDLLDQGSVTWADYYSDAPQAASFRNPQTDPHLQPISSFFSAAQAGTLPSVTFVDAATSLSGAGENDEHPGSDLRAGQHFVAQVVNAVRSGPNWTDSIVFISYDDPGGFYDHVAPPAAPQGGAPNPDGISPGQCADASNPPKSEQPGGGQNCSASAAIEASFCPGFSSTGAFPKRCANFNQLGFRVPLIVVSPFSKQQYVSHSVGDHTSLLALIEKRFLKDQHLTARDANADTLEDMFDFSNAPSLNAQVSPSLAPPPAIPCAP